MVVAIFDLTSKISPPSPHPPPPPPAPENNSDAIFQLFFATLALQTCGVFMSGASLNPARTFGPSLVSFAWMGTEAFWVGPLLGGCVAGSLLTMVPALRSESKAMD